MPHRLPIARIVFQRRRIMIRAGARRFSIHTGGVHRIRFSSHDEPQHVRLGPHHRTVHLHAPIVHAIHC